MSYLLKPIKTYLLCILYLMTSVSSVVDSWILLPHIRFSESRIWGWVWGVKYLWRVTSCEKQGDAIRRQCRLHAEHQPMGWGAEILSMGVSLGSNGWAFTPSPEASCLRKDVALNKATLWGWNKSWRGCPLQILQVGSTLFLQGHSSHLRVDYSYVWQFSLMLPS